MKTRFVFAGVDFFFLMLKPMVLNPVLRAYKSVYIFAIAQCCVNWDRAIV